MSELLDIGPKAATLRRLSAAGLPVPEARFLATAAFREHLERAGVTAMFESTSGTPLDTEAVRVAILSTPVGAGVSAQLSGWFRELGSTHVAVRSSADAEDLAGASFAGQHGTFFVADAPTLIERVRHCWASLYSDRATAYRVRAGIAHDSVAMGVIVQALVPAVAAGVAFTANPVDGSEGIYIEGCLGLGEMLVSGKVTPDVFIFDREDLALRGCTPGSKHVQLVVDGVGAVAAVSVAEELASTLAIEAADAREVAKLALRAEEILGEPVDVEWAFDGQKFWMLQARPITGMVDGGATVAPHGESVAGGTFPEPVATPDAAAPTDVAAPAAERVPAPIIWSNVNTGEILPDVISPMTWSIIYDHADLVFGGMFGALGVRVDAQKLVGLVGGRVYFNLSLVRESFSHVPGMKIDRVLGGMQEFVELPDAPAQTRRGRTLRLLRAGVALPAYLVRHRMSRAERFARVMRRATDGALGLPSPDSATQAFERVQALVSRFGEFSDALAFMLTAMIGFGALGTVTRRWLGDESGALANRLVAGRGDVSSAEAGHALWALGEFAAEHPTVREVATTERSWAQARQRLERLEGSSADAFLEQWDAFMAEHGHHCRGELEFANARWSERPDYVFELVRRTVNRTPGTDPMASYARSVVEAESSAEECRSELRNPLKRFLFGRVLIWGRGSARMRENIKSEAVRWMTAIRLALLEFGEYLVSRGDLERAPDVFLLRYEELEQIAQGVQGQWRDIVDARRVEHDRLAVLSPPPVVIGDWSQDDEVWKLGQQPTELRGITVSAGVARGPARVFLDVDSDQEVLPGEILVAPFTDPGWTPYFVPAAGIVVDMGGMLSHGSIIAREYGIPAVVNVGPATRLIETGQMIEVDGNAGVVRILGD